MTIKKTAVILTILNFSISPAIFALQAKPKVAFNSQVFNPGSTIKINIYTKKKLKDAAVVFNQESYKVYQEQPGVLRCLIGLPLAIKPGVYELTLKYKRKLFSYKESIGVVYINTPKAQDIKEKLRFNRNVSMLYNNPSVLDGSDQKLLIDAYNIQSLEQLWKDKFDLPVKGKISSNYGSSRVYNVGSRMTSYHKGVDFSAKRGRKILAANSGKVVLAKMLALSGNSVAIDHGQGIVSVYKHLSKIEVNEGDLIDKNAVVGLAGSTGISTGDHLHWEIRVQGVPVNPLEWTEDVF